MTILEYQTSLYHIVYLRFAIFPIGNLICYITCTDFELFSRVQTSHVQMDVRANMQMPFTLSRLYANFASFFPRPFGRHFAYFTTASHVHLHNSSAKERDGELQTEESQTKKGTSGQLGR